MFAVVGEGSSWLAHTALFRGITPAFSFWGLQNVRYSNYGALSGLKDEIGVAMGRSNYVASILILLIPLAAAGACLHEEGTVGLRSCAMFMCAGLLVTMSRGRSLRSSLQPYSACRFYGEPD